MDFDVLVFGGGIAGLWTASRLRGEGYQVAVLENRALGGVQSIVSQGIIHGGTKYALTGKLTGSAQAIGEMPGIWRACLDGHGEIDLSAVDVLAGHQLMWSTGSLTSGMAGFFAGKVMKSRMQHLERQNFPAPFDSPAFKGSVYRLEEPVLSTVSLLGELARQLGDVCFRIERPPQITRTPAGDWQVDLADGVTVAARCLVLAAGTGNESLLQSLGRTRPRMQRRPLQMVMARGPLPAIYAHCLGAGANPRITITSAMFEGDTVWYIGGGVSETGISRNRAQQIDAGRAEIAAVLPWLDQRDMSWATLTVDRAEVETPGNKRPDDSFVEMDDGVVTIWPTKLAFAPRVASLTLQALADAGIAPAGASAVAELALPRPPLAKAAWEDVEWS